jgi:hypothetical protein
MRSFNTDASGLYLMVLSAVSTPLCFRIEVHSIRTSFKALPSLPSTARVRWAKQPSRARVRLFRNGGSNWARADSMTGVLAATTSD